MGTPPTQLSPKPFDRQVELYKRAPRQVAYDGAFSSKANLEAIKERRRRRLFQGGFTVTDMVKGPTPVEISLRAHFPLEKSLWLDRCTWRSLPSFKSYVWSSIITCNLLVMARHLIDNSYYLFRS